MDEMLVEDPLALATPWHNVLSYARARTYALYAGARLGSVWQVLTPLMNAGVYYLAFGVLLGTKNGIHNYAAFLICGMFVFTCAS